MKIAVILFKDNFNLKMGRLMKEFLQNGHKLDAFSMYPDPNHLYMFQDMGIQIQSTQVLSKDLLEQYDILFADMNIFRDMHWLIDVKIYTVSFGYANLDAPLVGTDLMLQGGKNIPAKLGGHRAECAYLISGDPKHDAWNLKEIEEIPNRLLFIDSGHYPFGAEGKKAIAQFILDVCSQFPEYELLVKPRFLKSDKHVTHKNALFLYDFIEEKAGGKLPDNLTLLQKHYTLEELIASSHTVICTYTTAYLDAAAQGKNMVILDNLPNIDHPQLRIKTHWMPFREEIKKSGCLVDYHDAIQYLPEGIPCSEEHIKENIYSHEAINLKIVKSIEWFWKHYISQNQYPAPLNYFYDKLEDMPMETIPMEQLLTLRKKNYLYYLEFYFYYYTTYHPTDNGIEEYINNLENTGLLRDSTLDDLISGISEKLLDYAENIPNDLISQDYLLAFMLRSNKPEKVLKLKRQAILNKVFYDYVAGRAYFNQADYEKASQCLHAYLDGCVNFDSASGLSDLPSYHLSGLYYCGLTDMQLQHYDEAKQCFLECEKETDGNHGKAKEQLDILYQMEAEKIT